MTNSINDIIEREDYEGILAQDCWETLVLTVHETNTVTTANAIIKELEKRHMKTVKPAKAGKKTVAAAKKPVKTVGKKETTKPVKTAKPSKKETAKAVVTVKPVKTVKKPDTVTAKTIKKTIKTVKSVSSIPLSKKAKYFNSLKEGLTADFAKYQYNSKTGKNDVKIQVKKRWVVIYSLKNPKYHRNLLNNVRNRGAILAHCEIEKMTVIPKDGLKFDIVKGSDVPGEKQEKTVKKTGEKISEKKTVVNTYRSFPIIVHGLDQLEGLDKTGNVIDETTSNYVVEFHSKKTSVDYQVSFSKKTGLQVEAPERYSWKVNLEEVKTAKKYL